MFTGWIATGVHCVDRSCPECSVAFVCKFCASECKKCASNQPNRTTHHEPSDDECAGHSELHEL